MIKKLCFVFIATICPLYGVDEKKARPSLFLSNEESEQQLKEQVERLQSSIEQQDQLSQEDDQDQPGKQLRSRRRAPSIISEEAIDFSKDFIACYATSYLIANVVLQKNIPQKNLVLMGVAGALDLRLPRWIRFMLDMVI